MFQTITIHTLNPAGWPVDFQIAPANGKLDEAIEYLNQHGFAPAPLGKAVGEVQFTPDGLPMCPKHGAVMRKREKQGDVWHSHSIDGPDGQTLYCRGYPDKTSPGWNIE